MRIFISVAGPDRPKVEEVALALKDEGHKVFLDEHELPPGESYHRRIREAIQRADLAVFFISPLSLQADRYTLSELKLLQDKWSHPRGRVLPTLLTPMDLNKVPPYLRAVSICKPRGNIAAEVAYEVSRMGAELRRDRDERTTGLGDMVPLARGAIAAAGFGVLAAIIGVLTNQLAAADVLSVMPPLARFVFHGISLSLMVWLAALLFNIREPIAFAVLGAGCIAAFLFENLAWKTMGPTMGQAAPALAAGKSMIFALFAAIVVPSFRNVSRWACLGLTGLIAGQLAVSFGSPLRIFVWEALFVATVAFFLAVGEYDTARSS
jgi:TIR domain